MRERLSRRYRVGDIIDRFELGLKRDAPTDCAVVILLSGQRQPLPQSLGGGALSRDLHPVSSAAPEPEQHH
jgi:hypothetical protein